MKTAGNHSQQLYGNPRSGVKERKPVMASSSRVGLRIVEVVVVIAIMALMTSILMPSLSKSRQLAKQAMMMSRDGQYSGETASAGLDAQFDQPDRAQVPHPESYTHE
jgi:hypothetical protein